MLPGQIPELENRCDTKTTTCRTRTITIFLNGATTLLRWGNGRLAGCFALGVVWRPGSSEIKSVIGVRLLR